MHGPGGRPGTGARMLRAAGRDATADEVVSSPRGYDEPDTQPPRHADPPATCSTHSTYNSSPSSPPTPTPHRSADSSTHPPPTAKSAPPADSTAPTAPPATNPPH